MIFESNCLFFLIFPDSHREAIGLESSLGTVYLLLTVFGLCCWVTTEHILLFLLVGRTGLLGFGSKGALYPSTIFHMLLKLSNPEKWSRIIQFLYECPHGLDYTERIKCGFATNTGKPRLFCLLFQLKGKVSALFRGKSGRLLIRTVECVFTRTLLNKNQLFLNVKSSTFMRKCHKIL